MTTPYPPIEIFRRGLQTAADGTSIAFSDADLTAAAAAYDPALHQAPLVVGHPQHDAPAYGWVQALAYDPADGLLRATPAQVDPGFAEVHRAGRLKYHSASFYRPDAPTNPKPGVYYLRHLGFLGAQPPAVKGLAPAQFAAPDGECLTIAFADPDPSGPTHEDLPTMTETTAEFAEREAALQRSAAELTAREQALAQREAAAADQAAALHLTGCLAFCEGLCAQGRILPADRAGLARVLAQAPTGADAVHADFADGDTARDTGAWLRDWLGRLPVQVDYAERSAPAGAALPGADPVAQDKAAFARDPKLQAEFSDEASFLAFRRAERAGRVTVSHKLTAGD